MTEKNLRGSEFLFFHTVCVRFDFPTLEIWEFYSHAILAKISVKSTQSIVDWFHFTEYFASEMNEGEFLPLTRKIVSNSKTRIKWPGGSSKNRNSTIKFSVWIRGTNHHSLFVLILLRKESNFINTNIICTFTILLK